MMCKRNIVQDKLPSCLPLAHPQPRSVDKGALRPATRLIKEDGKSHDENKLNDIK